MKERDEWGHIINISSLSKNRASQLDVAGGGFYTATKTTVKAVTEGLRCEVCFTPSFSCIDMASSRDTRAFGAF